MVAPPQSETSAAGCEAFASWRETGKYWGRSGAFAPGDGVCALGRSSVNSPVLRPRAWVRSVPVFKSERRPGASVPALRAVQS